MVRATETAQIICESLPRVPTSNTDILREGAPIEPEPPSRHWKPEHWVRERREGKREKRGGEREERGTERREGGERREGKREREKRGGENGEERQRGE